MAEWSWGILSKYEDYIMKSVTGSRIFLILCLLLSMVGNGGVTYADDNSTAAAAAIAKDEVTLTKLSAQEMAANELIVNDNVTGLMTAIEAGHLDVNATIGGNPLTVVAINNNKLGIFEALIDGGANPNAVNMRGHSLLIIAAENVRPLFVDTLLNTEGGKNFL